MFLTPALYLELLNFVYEYYNKIVTRDTNIFSL